MIPAAEGGGNGQAEFEFVHDASMVEQLGLCESLRKHWLLLLRLSAVGFLINCQPSEPYLTTYLKDNKGLSEYQLDNYVWPFDAFGAFLFFLPGGVAAEVFGYRPVIVFGLFCRQATRLILLYGEGLPLMAAMQLTYAAASCVNFVYFAYAFLTVPTELFAAAAAFPLAAYHLGNVAGSLLAELLHTALGVPLKGLFYASWAFTSAGCLAFFALPAPQRDDSNRTSEAAGTSAQPLSPPARRAGSVTELWQMYRSPVTQIWACYWCFGYGSAYLIGNYYQSILYDIDANGNFGYSEAMIELAVFAAALSTAVCPLSLLLGRRAWLGIAPLAGAAGACTLATLQARALWPAYMLTAASKGLLAFLQAAGTAAIAGALAGGLEKGGRSPRYAAVLTTNGFVSLGLATFVSQLLAMRGGSLADYYHAAAAGCFLGAAVPAVAAGLRLCCAGRKVRDEGSLLRG